MSNAIIVLRAAATALLILVAGMCVAGFVAVITVGPISYAGCKARWSASGMPSSWGVFHGCIVQLPDGRWVPEDAVRVEGPST